MGFRFRRSVKLIPGVRLNFSARGASISLGAPGATLNFSGRGSRATFGIPGTGFSWSQSLNSGSATPSRSSIDSSRSTTPINTLDELESTLNNPNSSIVYGSSGRRLSDQQIETARRRFLDKKRRELASNQLVNEETKQRDIINAWRNTSDLPTADEYQTACSVRAFEFNQPIPEPYDETAEQIQLFGQIKSHLLRTSTPPVSYLMLKVTTPLITAFAIYGTATILTEDMGFRVVAAIVSAIGMAWLMNYTLSAKWLGNVDLLSKKDFEDEWPTKKLELDAAYSNAQAEYERRRLEAEKNWIDEETKRSAWAKRLVDGDVEALEDAVADTMTDLDFPFEATCDVAMQEDRTACLHLDLPEIEDVIPETRGQVLKDGRVRQVKRTVSEKNGEYAHLVTGLALFIANETLVVSPTLQTVRLAAYTQRKKRGSQQETDTYVYDIVLSRNQIESIDFATVEPTSFVVATATAFEQKANLELKALRRPSWTLDFEDTIDE